MKLTVKDLERIPTQLTAAAALLRLSANCECVHGTTMHTERWVDDEGVEHVEKVVDPVTGCASKLAHAHRVAIQAASTLRNAGGRGGKGGHSDPTAIAAAHPAVGQHWLATLEAKATAVTDAVAEFTACIHVLGTITATDPRQLANTGQGACEACTRFCSGAANDRLRSGYCDACRKAWDRQGRPDRYAFAKTRRTEPGDGGHAA